MMKKILSATVLSIALATSAMAQNATGSGTNDPGARTGTPPAAGTTGTDSPTEPVDPNATGATVGSDGMADRCKDVTEADKNTASGTAASDREDCPE
ncbi:MAG: hypothetical protein EOR84_25180 [Mesorhizobium sp.]|uniref:hypothetical protein n=1 Tax=Mesorhizobium sp. TaxID=1871066 RepID=UPI000FE7BEFC|nr:hypothetical protein [Mesorhizobium sp.]RWM89135.1 MAG: hypothetical protein EOR84_25180 [Mesorhizobium sp.]